MTNPNLSQLVQGSEESDQAASGCCARHTANADQIHAIAHAFCEAGYRLEMLTAEDRREDLECMRVVYHFNRIEELSRHRVSVDLDGGIPGAHLPSIVDVFPGADWFEREVFDMYGIVFDGHPNLRRILLPEDADFHALLKDFGRIEDAPDKQEAGQ